MFVRSWMSSPAVTLPAGTAAVDALELMQVRKIRRVPVLDEGRLAGIVTVGDLQAVLGVQEHSPRRARVRLGDLMTREVRTVAPDDPLERAARIMLEAEVAGLPVVEGAGVVGLITESDVFGAFMRIMGVLETGRRLALTVPEGGDLLGLLARSTAGSEVRSVAAWPSPGGGWEAVVRVRDPEPAKASPLAPR